MRCKTGTEVQFLLRILGYFAAKARKMLKIATELQMLLTLAQCKQLAQPAAAFPPPSYLLYSRCHKIFSLLGI